MKKLIKWLIIFLIVIVNYKSGRTETFRNVEAYYQNSSNIYIYLKGQYHPIKIPKSKIKSWEIKNE